MTKKDFLRRYLEADDSIQTKLDQIVKLRQLATKSTSVLSEDKVRSSGNTDKLGLIVSKIVDLENEVQQEICELNGIKAQVRRAIDSVSNENMRNILELRYINGMKWEQIAIQTSYDYSWVLRLHGQALQKVKIAT